MVLYRFLQLTYLLMSLNKTALRLPSLFHRTIRFHLINWKQIAWSEYYLRLDFMNCDSKLNVLAFFFLYIATYVAVLCAIYVLAFGSVFLLASCLIRCRLTKMAGFTLES